MEKETPVKVQPRVSANRSSNNWALVNSLKYHTSPRGVVMFQTNCLIYSQLIISCSYLPYFLEIFN